MVPPFSTTKSRWSPGGEVRPTGKARPLAICSRAGVPVPGGGGGGEGGSVEDTVIATVPLTASTVALIRASPALRPVTSPVEDTVATSVLALAHSTVRSSSALPSASRATAWSCTLSPTATVLAGASTVTCATAGGLLSWRSPPPSPQAQRKQASATRAGCRSAPASMCLVVMNHQYNRLPPGTVTQIPGTAPA